MAVKQQPQEAPAARDGSGTVKRVCAERNYGLSLTLERRRMSGNVKPLAVRHLHPGIGEALPFVERLTHDRDAVEAVSSLI
jgi:hypothetical protein